MSGIVLGVRDIRRIRQQVSILKDLTFYRKRQRKSNEQTRSQIIIRVICFVNKTLNNDVRGTGVRIFLSLDGQRSPWDLSHMKTQAERCLDRRNKCKDPDAGMHLVCIKTRRRACNWRGMNYQFSSVIQFCPTLCDPMDCNMPGFPVHHQLPELTQTHVHRVGDAIQPSQPLSFPSPPDFNLPQNQGFFQRGSSSHQVCEGTGLLLWLSW